MTGVRVHDLDPAAGDSRVYTTVDTPIGELLLAGDDGGRVTALYLDWDPSDIGAGWREDRAALAEPLAQLHAYFAGELTEFDLDVAMGGTPFQRQVWRALADIPYGETTSYGKVAAEIGHPSAVRAVGLANGRNPVPVIVPCHRVIGASGALTGYGGGLDRKRRLLELEARAATGTLFA